MKRKMKEMKSMLAEKQSELEVRTTNHEQSLAYNILASMTELRKRIPYSVDMMAVVRFPLIEYRRKAFG